ncbi:MAG: acetyl-CoA carboxylase carboxyltransferase subunit alpha [Alphaproteobacteria bacterium]|nr:acetyl-CoA carboxylase carboxyltransferase subunit alpha [Alphaproteobacteria bacterium]MCB9690529.1 acetyl-CoA carboxylase carboxyltransferase subunit alpha [Alphaproteobacteria bacterium]
MQGVAHVRPGPRPALGGRFDRSTRLEDVVVDVVLDFERPVVELQKRIEQLKELHQSDGVDLSASIQALEDQAEKLQERIFAQLSPWQRTLIARHPGRPFTLDYVHALFTEWTELHGDRAGFDDNAIIAGMARFRTLGLPCDGMPIMVMGHQKGRNTRENLKHNFGMARPDGYRKALRLMKLADRFNMPILTFIDTPGAYPGLDAEERGQAEAIARNILEMARLRVPIVAVVAGEGGSGGALALGVANRVLMLENSVYSVISPEGCAAILWRDRAEGPRAAQALKITAKDCLDLEVVDEVVPEPGGGAHRGRKEALAAVGDVLRRHFAELTAMSPQELVDQRYDRFRNLGAVTEV